MIDQEAGIENISTNDRMCISSSENLVKRKIGGYYNEKYSHYKYLDISRLWIHFFRFLQYMLNPLRQSCHDILSKNIGYNGSESLYLLYDRESPLAAKLSDVWVDIFRSIQTQILPSSKGQNIVIRELKNPPQPLYRGGLINPDNPHAKEQNRVITSHNIVENIALGLDHHKKIKAKTEEIVDPEIESIKSDLTSLPSGSIVVLIQSTNFRLSTFRIRLELFHRGVHVVEFNHLAYIKESEFHTFFDSLSYRTDEYVRLEHEFSKRLEHAQETKIISDNSRVLTFGPLEKIRGNTGDYTGIENKGGTFPIGEVFTEAIDLSTVNGRCLIEAYPREDFSVEHCESFELVIEHGRVLPSRDFPPSFQKLYDWIIEYEGEVMVRELGMGINPAITTATPLSDINFYERKTGVHLSLGKKHGIYGKKLPKTEVQRFHIDVFVALESVIIGDERVFEEEKWII